MQWGRNGHRSFNKYLSVTTFLKLFSTIWSKKFTVHFTGTAGSDSSASSVYGKVHLIQIPLAWFFFSAADAICVRVVDGMCLRWNHWRDFDSTLHMFSYTSTSIVQSLEWWKTPSLVNVAKASLNGKNG